MFTAADRLKWARELAGYDSANSFAEKHGFVYGTYSGWENGNRGIKPAVAQKLAIILKVDAAWLLTGVGKPRPTTELSPNNRTVSWAPIVSWVSAGSLSSADINGDADHYIPVLTMSKTIVAIQVEGTSMNRIAPKGAFIVVDWSQQSPYDGMLLVARVGDELTFKRYRDTNGPIRLEPDSTEPHETLYPGEGFEVLGRVISVVVNT